MKYVIIGNSAAAIGAVEGIRKCDSEGEITIISDEKHHTYSRPLISYWLKGDVTEESMKYRPSDFYKKNNVTALLGKRAEAIDAENKLVRLDDGSELPYDKLLCAAGSRPFVPEFSGIDRVKNKFTFMKLDDAKAVKKAVKKGARVLIVGAGLIGLKAAEALVKFTGNITVVDLSERILPSILDAECSAIMQKHIESKGVRFILGTSVKEFTENSAALTNGESADFDLLVLAVGVRPNSALVSEAGGEVDRGILTDSTQAVKGLSDVYAAGDCTSSYDITAGCERILALLPNAYMQGLVAGQSMAGGEAEYTKAIPMNAIGFFGLHIITAGSYTGEVYSDINENGCKKLFENDGVLKGFILMGDKINNAGIYTAMIREQTPLETVDRQLMKTEPVLMAMPLEYRKQKLGGIV